MRSTFEVRVLVPVQAETFDRFSRRMISIVERRVPRGAFSIEQVEGGIAEISFRIKVKDPVDFEVFHVAMRGIMYAMEKESRHA